MVVDDKLQRYIQAKMLVVVGRVDGAMTSLLELTDEQTAGLA